MDHKNRTRELTRLRVRRFRAVRKTTHAKKKILLSEAVSMISSGQGQSTMNIDNSAVGSSEYDDEEDFDSEEQSGEDDPDNEDPDNEEIEENKTNNKDDSDESKANDAERDMENNSSNRDTDESNSTDEGSIEGSESSNEEYTDEEEFNEILELRQWAVNSNIPHTHLDSLLHILRQRILPQLPKSAKTFLKTNSAEYDIKEFRGINGDVTGKFVYFGISKHLQKLINTDLHKENELYLQFNVDGLPLFKSSSQQFWPILCKIHFKPDVYKAFPVAVYTGKEKPNDLDEYFSSFIDELNELQSEGIQINGKMFKLYIKCFICDRPARSLIKCIKGHGGYYACERCTIHGDRYANRTVYISPDCNKRTDRSFRNQDQPEHHTNTSPLVSIPQLDMIIQFVLDFMHLCCLGIMKKLLVDIWLGGSLRVRLSQSSRRRLSQILISLQSQVPQDFQRTTRSLTDVLKWKATEFRFFLLYSGPVVLKNILPSKLYIHFLLLHVACRILCSEDLALTFNKQAKLFLKSFVLLSRRYYGTESQILNMHSLIHLADDVKNMQCSLSRITAFPFENALGKMKKLLRSGNCPLQQLCRRLHESFFANEEKVKIPPTVTILKQKRIAHSGKILIKKLQYKESILSCNSPDNTVLLENGLILRINYMYILPNGDQSTIRICGNILRPQKPIFTYPCSSEKLNMWQVTGTLSKKTIRLELVAFKMVYFKIDADSEQQKIYVMPLLHQ